MDRSQGLTAGNLAALAAILLALLLGAPAGAQKELDHKADYFDDDASGGAPPRVPTPGVYGVNGNSDVVITSDGLFLYAAGKTDDAVSIFVRNLEDGTLTPLGCVADPAGDALAPPPPEGGEDPQEIEPCTASTEMIRPIALGLSPDDAHLYVAADVSDGITGFARNAETGALTNVGTFPIEPDPLVLDRARSLVVTPDGLQLIAAGFDSNTLAVFSRNPTTGELVLLGAAELDLIPLPGDITVGDLGMHAKDLAITQDGTRIYLALPRPAAPGLSGLLVLGRDPATGSITPRQIEFNGTLSPLNGSGIGGIRSVAVSPDDKHVYATGGSDDKVVLFERNLATGFLDFVEAIGEGPDMDVPDGLGISPDGLRVYVLSKGGVETNALNVFERDPETGRLTLLETHRNNQGGIQGIVQPSAVVAAPDNIDVYIAGERADAVVHMPEPGVGVAQALVLAGLFALHRLQRSRTRAWPQSG